MRKSLAAYKLGYYSDHFIVIAETFAKGGLNSCAGCQDTAATTHETLKEIESALAIMASDLEPSVLLTIHRVMGKLARYADHLAEAGREFAGDDDRIFSCFLDLPFVEIWKDLVSLADDALKHVPRLYWWHNLGSAIAFVSRDAHSRIPFPAPTALPDLQTVLSAVLDLPESLINRIEVLGQLMKASKNKRLKNPVAVLSTALKWTSQKNAIERPGPVNLVLLLRQLDQHVRNKLMALPDGHDLSLRDNGLTQSYAILDGITYAITKEQYLILRSLMDECGRYVTASEMIAKHGVLLLGKRVGDRIRELPNPLSDLINIAKKTGGGFRLNLD